MRHKVKQCTYFCSSWPGLRMTRSRGNMWMKTRRTHGAIVCVWGERKWTFRTTTVMHILNVSNIIVNKTNLPIKGTTSDVGGIISARSRKNTVSDSKMLMERLTYNKKKYKRFWKYFTDNNTNLKCKCSEWASSNYCNIIPSLHYQMVNRRQEPWAKIFPCTVWSGWQYRTEFSGASWC